MPSVERCELVPGFSISRVLTGLWQIADMERDGGELDPGPPADAMGAYVDAGLTTFDMADHYGSAEVIAGVFRSRLEPANRAGVQMLTKWVPKPGRVQREDVRDAIQRSLDRMQCERLDLLQLHTWNYADLSYLDCLGFLQELREEGRIAHLGLTNFDTPHLRVVVESGIEIVSNQVSYSLLDQRAAGAMAAYCAQRGVHILAYGTLAGGLLTERWLGRPEPADEGELTWSQRKYKRFVDAAGGWERYQRVLADLAELAGAQEISLAALATRYILGSESVGGIIVGARLGESEHIAANCELARPLDGETRAAVARALTPLERIPGDCGDEYRRPPFLTASGDLSHHLDGFPSALTVEPVRPGRSRVGSGVAWEKLAGYARAVRDGRRILVSGTTATHGDAAVGGDDPAAQTHFILDKIGGAVEALGGRWEDIVRTRVYVRDIQDWEAVARAHGERFAEQRPANTLVQTNLVGDVYRVEIEAEAMLAER